MLPTAHTSLGHLLTSNLWFLAPITFPPLLRSTNCAYVPWSSPHLQSFIPGLSRTLCSRRTPREAHLNQVTTYQARTRPLIISLPPLLR
jgi:hypothetical protein